MRDICTREVYITVYARQQYIYIYIYIYIYMCVCSVEAYAKLKSIRLEVQNTLTAPLHRGKNPLTSVQDMTLNSI